MFTENREPLTPAHLLPISWQVFTPIPWSAPKLFEPTHSCRHPPLSNDIWFVANERMKYEYGGQNLIFMKYITFYLCNYNMYNLVFI